MDSEVFKTVLSGVGVYIISEYFLELILKPHIKYKSLVEKVGYIINLYSCYLHTPYNIFDEKNNARPKEEYDNASNELRKLASELAGYLGTIPKVRFIKRKKISNVIGNIAGLSKGMYLYSDYNPSEDNKKCIEIIQKLLKISIN